MILLQLVAPQPAPAVLPAIFSSLRRSSHAPDPELIASRAKRSAIVYSQADSERILADFARLYVGPARGIDKVELESSQDGGQKIVVFVSDWNGILNVPTNYQGMEVSFTQFVPSGATWQL